MVLGKESYTCPFHFEVSILWRYQMSACYSVARRDGEDMV